MKKVLLTILAIFMVASLFALDLGIDISGAVSPVGYMNHAVTTVFKDNINASEAIQGALETQFGEGNLVLDDKKSTQIYNAYALGLDLNISFFYLSMIVGLPVVQNKHGFDPLAIAGTNKVGGSVILDTQLGGGITLMKDKPFNVFVGGGIAVNYIHTKREIDKIVGLEFDKMNEIQNILQAGLGLRAAVNYFFTDNVGIAVTLSDSILFLPLMHQRYIKFTLKDGRNGKYFLTKNRKADIKENIKYSWSNNFVLRLGVAFKI